MYVGGYLRGRMKFPNTWAPLRTGSAFAQQEDEGHNKDRSPFLSLEVGMLTSFQLDYMHLVCLGVTRRLLLIWLKGDLSVRLNSALLRRLSAHLHARRC